MPHFHLLCVQDEVMRNLSIGKRAKFICENSMEEGIIVAAELNHCTISHQGKEIEVPWGRVSGVFDG